MTPLHFPESVPGRLRVAYLIAQAIAEQNGDHRPHCDDKGGGRVWVSGIVDLGAVVDALLAAAPATEPVWWNDGPIRDLARDGCVRVLENHGYNLPGVADLCAGAALQVAHRAGYAPCREVTISGVPADHEVVLFHPIGGGDPIPFKGSPIQQAEVLSADRDSLEAVLARVEAVLDEDQRSGETSRAWDLDAPS